MSWQRKTMAFAGRWSGRIWCYQAPFPRDPELLPATLQLLIFLYLLPFRLYLIAWLWVTVIALCVEGTLLYPIFHAARGMVRAIAPSRQARQVTEGVAE